MIKSGQTLSQVKSFIQDLKSKPVKVTVSLGRNKFVSFSGTLSGVYSALFTVVPFDKSYKGKTSYSYSEYMCGRVKLSTLKQA
ncbi:MAG: Veg family protein [Clostridia bacterium]|nr:Veg family protein [Clostridia bacterium]